jgi:hypothetical protein
MARSFNSREKVVIKKPSVSEWELMVFYQLQGKETQAPSFSLFSIGRRGDYP